MIKKLYYLFVLLVCSALWNPVGAVVWTYDVNMGLVTNANDDDPDCQFSCDFKAGTNETSAEGSYANLIDGDNTTFFTSAWDGTAPQPDDHPHWLQVDLKDQPQQRIFFTMSMRYDSYGLSNRPTKFILYASNDTENWTQITEITDLHISMDIPDYTSTMIDLGDTYRYLRFAVPSTNGGGYIGNYPYFAIGEFQVYQAIEATDPVSVLKQRFTDLNTLQANYIAGTDPGYYPEEKYNAFITALDNAEAVVTQGQSDKAEAALTRLNTAYEDLLASEIAFKDGGYYYIYSRYTVFEDNQPDVQKAMYADVTGLNWGNLEKTNGKFAFIVRKLEDGNYTLQNVATKEYVRCIEDANGNFTDATDTQVKMSAEPDAEYEQVLKDIGCGQWNIFNTKNSRAYNTQGHSSGAGISGTVCSWTVGVGSEAAWSFREITDEELIKSLTDLGPKQVLAEKMQSAITAANAVRNKANDYAALITSAEQISSNAQSTGDGSAYANLIDGSTSTIFHSVWDGSMGTFSTTEGTGWHNLQFNLGKEVSKIRFSFIGRDNSSGWHDNPNHITLYGTNDDNLGASTAAADSAQWTEIVDMTKDAYGFPGNDNLVSYESPLIDLNGSYKYLRFVVKHVSTMDGGNRATSFVVPEITGVTFNLSEFQVYDGTPIATSEYYTVNGMKEACDELDKLIAEGLPKVANLTATEEDIAALNASAEKVSGLYVDRAAFDTKLAELKSEANDLYNTMTGSRVTLLTDASQLSSNSISYTDAGSNALANLLDGDKSTIFHSYWSTDMQNASITADEWETVMAAVESTALSYTGVGYHNLQVKLNEPVKNFYFEYYGRVGSDWHDNPNDIAIYATNDDELGASTDEADLSSWKEIIELTEGFPEDVEVKDTPYTSPTIDLGDSYKYIRFVIKNTTHAGKVDSRTFNNPDVTGITWNASEFQMYSGLEKDRIQYEYVPGMKEACDAMKAILNEAEKMGSNSMVTSEFNDKFEAAINAVRALAADTTDVVALYNKYVGYADKSVVSDENNGLGYVDSEESIEAFRTALTSAKGSIDRVSPLKSQIEAATASMKEAFKTFISHVGQLEPNKWYNIFGGSLRAYTQGQPVFLASTSTGDQLHIGGYPIDEEDPTIDPYAIWRLVPIEGQEPSDDYSIGCYAIQSMGTGQYFGAYRGQGASVSPLMSHEKTPYNIYYYGNGKFKMQQVGVENDFDCLKTDQTNFVVLNYPADGDEQQSFIFKPIAEDQDAIAISYYFDNSLNTMVVPWAVSDLSKSNYADVKTYAVKSFTATETGSRLELKEKTSFEAGEPFIILVNDYTNCDGDTKQPVIFNTPQDVTDTSAIVANGLVGTLEGMTVATPGMGIFTYDSATTSWKLSATSANYFLSGRYAYLDPKMVVNEEGDADLIIDTDAQITAVKSFTVMKATEKVNVYSIDGKLIKKGVKATEANKGLNKGIYIIGKKKISVK